MSEFDWTPFLRGGATRPDAITGLDPAMSNALAQMLAAAPGGIAINSAYRSPAIQAQLYENALARYGNEAEARRWVAPPGRSQHNFGRAVDLAFESDAAREWAHANAEQFGLAFPLSNENWHLELMGARDRSESGIREPNGFGEPAQVRIPEPRVEARDRRAGDLGTGNAFAMLDPADFMIQRMQYAPVQFAPTHSVRR